MTAGPGRPKGSPNRSLLDVKMKAEELGIDPFKILLLFAAGDWKKLGYPDEKFISNEGDKSVTYKFHVDPAVRAKCAQEAVQYLYPKRKALEVTDSSSVETMTPSEKLEAMRAAVNLLETKVKDGSK